MEKKRELEQRILLKIKIGKEGTENGDTQRGRRKEETGFARESEPR